MAGFGQQGGERLISFPAGCLFLVCCSAGKGMCNPRWCEGKVLQRYVCMQPRVLNPANSRIKAQKGSDPALHSSHSSYFPLLVTGLGMNKPFLKEKLYA